MADKLRAVISVRVFGERKCFGPGVAELLRRVDEHRSLRAAAQSMNMAYSKAWTILHTAEEELGFPLLDVRIGGRHGGGAALTENARRVLGAYERVCARLREQGEAIFAEEFSSFERVEENTEESKKPEA